MIEKPIIRTFEDGSTIWSHTFDTFRAKVYVPLTALPEKIINFGFEAPYLLVLEEEELEEDAAKAYADGNGLAKVAAERAGSVVFIYPTCAGGWQHADEALYVELIAHSKIHEYHEAGMAVLHNRFTGKCDGYAIRGAIFRAYLFGKGSSADYIAGKLLKTINGEGLWGPADVTPTACILENLGVMPVIERKDIPIVSLRNAKETDAYIMEKAENCYIAKEADYEAVYREFLKDYKRWGWVGTLELCPDFKKLGMVNETGIVTVTTSPDNCGDDRGSQTHKIGYLAYYNNDLFAKGAAPLMICFHGGGDSAMHIAQVSEWYRVAHDHDFLLVCVENHLNSTATETKELLEHLCARYNIDQSRIYASGFSMGGCKSWDLYQEYPQVFAGLAPMSATFDVGCNLYGKKVEKEINRDVIVPVFYAGGEITPLPELPFQAQKCLDRMAYVLQVNRATKPYDVKWEDQEHWENPIWGVNGDRSENIYDAVRDSTLTLQYFDSEDGNCYSVFGSISGQGHECRYHTCEQAWRFLSRFRRAKDGQIVPAE